MSMKKDLMDCCEMCTKISHDKDGGESAECTDDLCPCHTDCYVDCCAKQKCIGVGGNHCVHCSVCIYCPTPSKEVKND